MPVRVNITKSKDKRYIYILRSYVNENGDPRSEKVKSFGRYDDDEDSQKRLAKAEEYVRLENEKEEQYKLSQIHTGIKKALHLAKQADEGSISQEDTGYLNFGVVLVKILWDNLGLDSTFRYLADKREIEYDYARSALLLTAGRILKV